MTGLEQSRPFGSESLARGVGHIRLMDPGFDDAGSREWCSDAFFPIQAAWVRRELEALRPLLTKEMYDAFQEQVETLRASRQINRMKNIAVHSIELTEAWQAEGLDYITVRYLASLLDYAVDETSGKLVEGSDTKPVPFDECWTWVRHVGPNPWRVSTITQED